MTRQANYTSQYHETQPVRVNHHRRDDGDIWYLVFAFTYRYGGRNQSRMLMFPFNSEQEARSWLGQLAGITVRYNNGVPVQITSVGVAQSQIQENQYVADKTNGNLRYFVVGSDLATIFVWTTAELRTVAVD